jgi:hypothetical protein
MATTSVKDEIDRFTSSNKPLFSKMAANLLNDKYDDVKALSSGIRKNAAVSHIAVAITTKAGYDSFIDHMNEKLGPEAVAILVGAFSGIAGRIILAQAAAVVAAPVLLEIVGWALLLLGVVLVAYAIVGLARKALAFIKDQISAALS